MRYLRFRAFLLLSGFVGTLPVAAQPPEPQVPAGFTIQKVAGYPRLHRPIFAGFDETGILYVGESSGDNLNKDQMLAKKPHWITRLEDTDDDGVFDKSTRFVDNITLPQGCLWYRGSLYAACPPSIWKFTDTDGDGQADQREEILTGFGFNGNACDTHGPFLSPTGRLYIVQGRHGHEFKDKEGNVYSKGKAGRIYSCRLDGSDVRVHAGGGFDNPVEVDFTEEGECIGTVNILYRDRGDCLMHWVEGGVYPREDQADCVAEFKWTGGLLGPIHNLGHVAVSGLMRYRGVHFGDSFKDRWFFTEFNTHKVRYAKLNRAGSTFTADVHEFLTSADGDFHPTDVLEDADGSLLVLNTGGWFRNGCPTSVVAKPEIYGGIYRIRKTGGEVVQQPRNFNHGNVGAWIFYPTHYLARDYIRPAVRETWVELWSKVFSLSRPPMNEPMISLGEASLQFLRATQTAENQRVEQALRDGDQKLLAADMEQVLNRGRREQNLPEAAAGELSAIIRAQGRAWLTSPVLVKDAARIRQLPTESERLVALTTLADLSWKEPIPATTVAEFVQWSSNASLPELRSILQLAATRCMDRQTPVFAWTDELIQQCAALPAHREFDRITEHALIVALQRSGRPQSLLSSLRHPSVPVRHTALIALDQMDNSPLTQEMVIPLLSADDAKLQQTALEVIARRPGWAAATLSLLKTWVGDPELSADRANALRAFLLAQLGDPAVQGFITELLNDPNTRRGVRELVWEVLQRSTIAEWPEAWNPFLASAMFSTEGDIALAALRIITQRSLSGFEADLRKLAATEQRRITIRCDAIMALSGSSTPLDDNVFFPLLQSLGSNELTAEEQAAVARALGNGPLSATQLRRLSRVLDITGPLVLPVLIKAFSRSTDAAVGQELVATLLKSDAVTSISPDELAGLLRRYPDSVRDAAQPLFHKLGVDPAAQAARLAELSPLLAEGDAKAGRNVFFGKKANCGACHAVAGEGGRVGPHLTTIGASRAPKDLLEAIVYPSASFVNGYRPYVVATDDGKVVEGVISAETTDAITLRTKDLQEIRVRRDQIDELREASTSIMPKGLDTQLTPGELRNLLAYLQARK